VSSEVRAYEEQWQQDSGSKHTRRHEGERKWEGTEESVVRSRSERSGGRKAVEKVGGGVRLSAQERGGREAWIRRVQMTSFVV
jgi:hypothetical protein